MGSIFSLLFVIFSIIPIQSAALIPSDVPSTSKKPTIPKLVENVCEKLKTKELTFVSQVPEEVYTRFTNGMKQASIVLASVDHSRKLLLDVLQTKAQELYATKQLNSMWLMYLGLGCAKLLSKFNEPLSLPLGCATFAEELDIFAIVHNHRIVLREPMLKWSQEIRPSLSAWPEAKFTHELLSNTSLSYDMCDTLNEILHTDCFWLPIISRKPLFSHATFNRALVHRVALVGVPLGETTGFDGIPQTNPYAFASHDVEHAAAICFPHYREGKVSHDIIFLHLGFEVDPVVFLWQPIWNFIQSNTDETQKKIDEFVFFWLIHEGKTRAEESSTFKSMIDTALLEERQYHDRDYSSETTYNSFGYEESKRDLQEQIKYLRSIKDSLFDPSIESSGEIGRAFCAFLEGGYDSLLNRYKRSDKK